MADYKSLKHARGAAANLPNLLRQLDQSRLERSKEDSGPAWENALAELRRCLVVPGRAFGATEPAIADLGDFVRRRVPGYPNALLLLADIATADHRDWIATRRGKDRKAVAISSKGQAVVDSLIPNAIECLASADELERIAAGFFLGCASREGGAAEPALLDALARERNGLVLGSHAIGLAALAEGSPRAKDALWTLARALDIEGLARGAAAVGLLWLGESDQPDLAEALCGWLEDGDEWEEKSRLRLPWARGNRERLVCLIGMGEGRQEAVLGQVLSSLACGNRTKPVNPYRTVRTILGLTGLSRHWPAENDLEDDPIDPDRAFSLLPEELSPLQRQAMEALSKLPDIEVGLPVPKYTNVFGRWLELEPSGILEERLELRQGKDTIRRPRWWVWENLDRKECRSHDIERFVAGLPALEQLKLGFWINERIYGATTDSNDAFDYSALLEVASSCKAEEARAVSAWADELLRFRPQSTKAGPVSGASPIDRALIMRAILSSGARLKPEWVALTPWPGDENRSIYEKLPFEFREEGAYRNLLLERCNLFKECLETLELYPSRRMVERLLEQNFSLEKMMRPSSSYQKLLVPKLEEMAKSNAELKVWYDAWMKRFVEEGEIAHLKHMEERGVANEYLIWDLGILATQRLIERILVLAVIDQKQGRSQLYWTRDSLGWLACERKEVAEWILGWEEKRQKKALVSERKKWAGENQAVPKDKSAATSKAKEKVPPKPAKETSARAKKAGANPATKASLPKKKAGAKK